MEDGVYGLSPENTPTYVPVELVQPDFPGVDGSAAGFTSMPNPLADAFDAAPGSGGSYTAMTPLWGTIPPTEGNAYFDAVNEAIGTDIRFQISDGNTYGDKLAAVLASPRDVADWTTIPEWNVPPRFHEAVGSIFADLTPYLAGDAIKDYPYLANIPTEAWQACSWNGKIYGLPQPREIGITDYALYRADLVGDDALPTNPDELIDFAVAHTGDGTWGTNDLWSTATAMFGVLPENGWKLDEDGELVNRVETPEYRAAVEWMAKLYASGAVHPDAVADNQSDSGTRFESGQVVLNSTGLTYWGEALARNRSNDPEFDINVLPLLSPEGVDPVIYKPEGAAMCSFLKQTDDDARIAELLEAANFLAAPFGTEENQLITYGVEGVHFMLDANGVPVATPEAQREVQPTFAFLTSPPAVTARADLPDYVERRSTWSAENAQYLAEPLFYGMNIAVPNRFASLGQPFDDLQKDIARGRASLDDLDAAIETWRSSGGDDLRAFYTEIYDAQQSAEESGS
ncbi:extracellular solute-binding protein [Microbacterium sp. NPDC089189]|uniref:extracellular solute-binding protein n=1 Tax=Microbacterium sp. NPDC089189 TaxID=3154972 RepID=UPI003431DAB5